MSREKRGNLAASVHQRLLNISHKTGADPNLTWSRYAMERLLYRLASSKYAGKFVLKGAMLFEVWTGRAYRPTYDLDLLGFGENSPSRVSEIFKGICKVAVEPDGLVFDAESVRVESIREDLEYHGQRVSLNAMLGSARVPLRVDIGFGDVVTPKAEQVTYPTLLDFPAPHIKACPRETVVAEKLHTATILGIANSRMKDFHDLYVLARDFAFNGTTLAQALRATFGRRRTDLPDKIPFSLTDEFGQDDTKSTQWNAFLRKSGIERTMPGFAEVISYLRRFLLPPLKAAFTSEGSPGRWEAGGPWKIEKPDKEGI